MKAVYVNSNDLKFVQRIFTPALHAALSERYDIENRVFSRQNVLSGLCRDAELVFSTWGMPEFSEDEIREYFPALRAVFYGAGTVQAFAKPFLHLGIHVFSAWQANGIPVAEVTFSEIVLANKGMLRAMREIREVGYEAAGEASHAYPGNFGANLGIIGCGVIGRRLIRMIHNAELNLNIKVFDPFLSDEAAEALGVRKTDLPDIFETCSVVSNHLANNPQTVHMLDYALFSRMQPSAVFINTGRGAQVVEEDLIRALREVPTRTAILDVTWPEPPEPGHPFYSMKNVFLTPHLAGSVADETERMGWFMLEESDRYIRGETLRYEVTLKMLETMA